ncbi:PREDICTED: uncharacterized protein LOC107353109 [Acropora digitifera]|uniref:uncharacterized protein LOC107353109 n=1 Tax=Acropora digitifera TaxID=70779 RepID=UPI00077AC9AC|nr:PREDICTED: uncharacterized protein LOC107353109 [Acropora digitifera]
MATGGNHGREKTEWPESREEFVKWFWSKTNGNELIKDLNRYDARKRGNDYIRREKERPMIYGIVLNDDSFPGTKEGDVEWKLCKVGFTHVNTAPGSQNRMEQVQAQIESKYELKRKGRKAETGLVFVLAIGAVDVTTFSDTEKRIRNATGWPIRKDVVKNLQLPCSTEWVLTTQQFIKEVKKQIDSQRDAGTADVIDLFKKLKFKDFNRHKEPPWVKLQDVDGVPTVTHFEIRLK